MTSHKNKRNSLTIRLAESAVFLQADHSHALRNNGSASSAFSRNGMLRGLLVLHLVKPTKITSIEVELTALTTTSCPEGIGPRRVEVTEQHQVFHASTTFFSHKSRSSSVATRPKRSASVGPGVYYQDQHHGVDDGEESEEDSWEENRSWRSIAGRSAAARRQTHSRTRTRSSTPQHVAAPSDGTDSPSRPASLRRSVAPIPPYSALAPPDARHLYPVSPNSSSALLRRPSFTNTIFEDEPESSTAGARTNPTSFRGRSEPPVPPRTGTQPVSISTAPSTPNRNKRFSFSTVSNIVLDAVNSASQRKAFFSPVRGIENDRRREDSLGRNPRSGERGRAWEREERNSTRSSPFEIEEAEGGDRTNLRDIREEKEKTSFISKILGDNEDGSKEFKEGTYTYPITFTIPSSAPPTLQAEYGSVSWRLKAFVHRPGAFHPKFTAEREVVVITCPTEEETEESENIIVERSWDQQLQYLISVSGKAFFIGGTVPISFVLLPLDKVKVHRIAVYIEEKVEYFSRFQRPLRSDPPLRFCLLSLRNEGKNPPPILPLESSSPDVLRSSPVFKMIDRETRHDPDEMGELAASLMGPGPWKFHGNLKLPSNCDLMKFTNKNLQANVRVSHFLKVVMRLEKAPGAEDLHTTGHSKKQSLFDVVVQTPVVIFSCRCNPDWVSLPRYTEVFDDAAQDMTLTCPCRTRQKSVPSSPGSSADSLASVGPPIASASYFPFPSSSQSTRFSPRNHHELSESMLQSSSLFERLVSGQESETGEAPPAYDARIAMESITSVAVREVQVGTQRSSRSAMVGAEQG